MGTTSQYGWPYPDPSDFVTDAPQAFEDLADAIETTFTEGILQVVTAVYSTRATNATNSYADTGLTATITPASTSSRVLVIVSQSLVVDASATYAGLNLVRNSTTIHESMASATGPYDYGTGGALYTRANIIMVDSPASASAVTYKTQFRRYANAGAVFTNGDTSETNTSSSYITLLEVAS